MHNSVDLTAHKQAVVDTVKAADVSVSFSLGRTMSIQKMCLRRSRI